MPWICVSCNTFKIKLKGKTLSFIYVFPLVLDNLPLKNGESYLNMWDLVWGILPDMNAQIPICPLPNILFLSCVSSV